MIRWDAGAADAFVRMPIGDGVKESIKLLEKC